MIRSDLQLSPAVSAHQTFTALCANSGSAAFPVLFMYSAKSLR
jgi:hypothetical protein